MSGTYHDLNFFFFNKNPYEQALLISHGSVILLIRLPPGVQDCNKQRRHHLSDAGGLEECGLEQHHQADTLHHGGLTRGTQAAYYPLYVYADKTKSTLTSTTLRTCTSLALKKNKTHTPSRNHSHDRQSQSITDGEQKVE